MPDTQPDTQSDNTHKTHYSAVAKTIHFVTALLILGLLPLGFFMVDMPFSPLKLDIYTLHKSFGMTVFGLSIIRVIWRVRHAPPPHLPTHRFSERILSKIAHLILYAGIFILPVSGWIMSSAGNFPNSYFGLFLFPDLVAENKIVFERARDVHEITALAMFGVLVLHAIGALKHHIIDRDITLRRMMPARFFALLSTGLVILLILSAATTSALLLRGDGTHQHDGTHSHTTSGPDMAAQTAPTEQERSAQLDTGHDHSGTPASTQNTVTTWDILHDRSTLTFTASVYGKDFQGSFETFDGTILFDENNPADSMVGITVKTASAISTSAERDGYLKMPAWFDVETFPEARFYTDHISKDADNGYIAHGTLTLKGTEKPLDLPFTLTPIDDPVDDASDGAAATHAPHHGVKMNGTATINRSLFAVGTDQWQDTDMVANDVTITIVLYARPHDRPQNSAPQATKTTE